MPCVGMTSHQSYSMFVCLIPLKKIKYGLFINHNTTSFYSLFIQADMFLPVFLGHLQVTRNVCLEEVIQVSHKIKYMELKFNN
jgi:hypothetical protein